MTCSSPHDWPEKSAATLARIEAKLEEPLGNGQPGRVQRLEQVECGTAERVAAVEAAHNQ